MAAATGTSLSAAARTTPRTTRAPGRGQGEARRASPSTRRYAARRYANRGEGPEDPVQVGSIGARWSRSTASTRSAVSDLPELRSPTITGVIKRHCATGARSSACLGLSPSGRVAGVRLARGGRSSEIDEAMQTDGAFDASESGCSAGLLCACYRERGSWSSVLRRAEPDRNRTGGRALADPGVGGHPGCLSNACVAARAGSGRHATSLGRR